MGTSADLGKAYSIIFGRNRDLYVLLFVAGLSTSSFTSYSLMILSLHLAQTGMTLRVELRHFRIVSWMDQGGALPLEPRVMLLLRTLLLVIPCLLALS